MQICDFANSYTLWTGRATVDTRKPGHMPWPNDVRIQIDARCVVTHTDIGESDEYVLITPCRTEWMYREDVLWQQPNYEFCGIWLRTEFLGGHVKPENTDFVGDLKRATRISDKFDGFEIKTRYFDNVSELATDAEVHDATREWVPTIARTEHTSEDGKIHVMSEYPVKTMNIQPERKLMQVDTGPMLFADLEATVESDIERLWMAYICYNNRDVVEFVLRRQTTVAGGGTIVDYSDVRRMAGKTTLYRAG